jgi:tRNA (mo5U34)-methyltransferase
VNLVAKTDVDALRRNVDSLQWYHTIELAPGLTTPGWFDTREVARHLPMPKDLSGQRCLDVGTFNGFWAFEMERRGAQEVVAVDVLDPHRWDWPLNSSQESITSIGERMSAGRGFELAREALGSRVERKDMSIYELDPDVMDKFDFVYVGSLLMHLRDPVGAMQKVRSVCRGRALVVDAIDLLLTLTSRRPVASLDGRGRPWWWKANLAGLARIVESAGFDLIGRPSRLYMPCGRGQLAPRPALRTLVSRAGAEAWVLRWRGDPHGAVLAAPGAASD